jgi:hypothetical protein
VVADRRTSQSVVLCRADLAERFSNLREGHQVGQRYKANACLLPAFQIVRPQAERAGTVDSRRAPGYGFPQSSLERRADGKRAVVMHRSAPLPGRGDECFARYGLHDAYDSWITYGFVDEDVPFVQSVRTTLDLPGAGTIRLGHVSATRESDETEDSAQNAKFYLPRILSKKANRLVVAAVMIPDLQAPRVLRRTLRILMGELTDRQQNRSDLVMLAEKQIINANLAYYTGLKTCLGVFL